MLYGRRHRDGRCLEPDMPVNTSTLALYLATWVLVAVSPGPAVLYVIAQASRGGVRRSLAGIAGLQLGSLLFFVAVGMGLAALLATLTKALMIMRIAGAFYLGCLGATWIWNSFRSRAGRRASAEPETVQHGRVFWQGLLIQLTNPKAFLFASALLPQFIDSQRPMLGQISFLFAVTFVVDMASMLTYASLAAHGARQFRESSVSVWLERVLGAALIGFGLRLVLTHK